MYGFKQLVKNATRTSESSSSLIDLILTNSPGSISSTGVFATSISDHDIVGCIRKINTEKYQPRIVLSRNLKSYNPVSMNKELDAIDWSLLYSLKNVDVAVNLFNAKLKAIFDRHAPLTSKKVRGQQCPWISNEIRDQMNNRDYLLKRARRTKSPVDWDAYKSVRNACNITIRKSKQTHQRNLLSENRLNPRAFWQIIKNIFPTKSKEIASESLNLQKSDQANRFGTFFANAENSLKI